MTEFKNGYTAYKVEVTYRISAPLEIRERCESIES